MTVATKKKRGKIRKPNRTINYAADARLLGVSRNHLRLVLLGERQSDPLLQRWLGLDQQRRKQQTHSQS